jgi:hypothetical protein
MFIEKRTVKQQKVQMILPRGFCDWDKRQTLDGFSSCNNSVTADNIIMTTIRTTKDNNRN